MADAILAQCGIYQIRNTVNGKVYVGSAVCFPRRKAQHYSLLRKGMHHSQKLQSAWLKYGEESFSFEVLEVVEDLSLLVAVEQRWIDGADAAGDGGYNARRDAGSMLGFKHSPEARKKMSANRRGKVPQFANPAERLQKIAAANRRRVISEETRAKMSAASARRKHGAEAKEKLSAHNKGRKLTAEHIAKITASCRGYVPTPETIEKLRISHVGKVNSAESNAKRSASLMGRVCSAETKAKISAKARERAQRKAERTD